MARKVIITCAVTGAIHTPSMSKALPVTPQEIADAAVDAAEAGAAIVHLHARNPKTGQPDQSPEAFAPFLKIIKQRSNCVINLTTGGAPTMTVDERVRPAAVYKPEVASLNMGSMNFGFFGMLNRFKKFEHDWELKHLQNKDIVFRNTFQDIEYVLKTLSETGTRFEFECYDTAHLYNLDYFLQQGLVKPPLFVQTVFGLQGGTGAHPEDVLHMKRTADRLFGDKFVWSVLGAGRNQLPIAAMAAAMGGNIRVGLEDSLWAAPGRMAASNAEQVTLARKIIEGLGPRGRHFGRGARDSRPQGRRQAGGLNGAPFPGRSAARSSCVAVRCRAGAVTNTSTRYGPGSAKRHEECRIAPGTRYFGQTPRPELCADRLRPQPSRYWYFPASSGTSARANVPAPASPENPSRPTRGMPVL